MGFWETSRVGKSASSLFNLAGTSGLSGSAGTSSLFGLVVAFNLSSLASWAVLG